VEYPVIFKKPFTTHLFNLLTYLESEWGKKAVDEFYAKVVLIISRIRVHPFLGAPSKKIKGVRGILVTKYNRIFYWVHNNTIIILMLADTRRRNNPY